LCRSIVGPLTALWLLAVFPGKYQIVFALTLLPGIAAAALIGVVVREKKRAPVPHASFGERLCLLPRVYRRLLLAVGIFGAGAFAHTLLILWAAQRDIADHADSRTTKLHDRRQQVVLREDVERIRY
jgi:MFS family permease